MAIVNRDLDSSQQRQYLTGSVTKTLTGTTYCIATIPHQARLLAASEAVIGLSGAPNHSLWVQRFLPGVGVTSFVVGASMVAVVYGTSGGQSFAVLGSGTSNVLQTNDLILLSTAAANTAAEHVSVTLVIQALQDIISDFGV